jgi:hypothetical protein
MKMIHVPTTISEDNTSCIAMSHNPAKQEHSKHIDKKVFILCDMVLDKVLNLEKYAGKENIVDAKSISGVTLAKHCEYL